MSKTFSDVFVVVAYGQNGNAAETCAVYIDPKEAARHAESLLPETGRVGVENSGDRVTCLAGGEEGYKYEREISRTVKMPFKTKISDLVENSVTVLLSVDATGDSSVEMVSNSFNQEIVKAARELGGDPDSDKISFNVVPVPEHASEFSKIEVRDNGDLIAVITSHFWDGLRRPDASYKYVDPPPPKPKCAICGKFDAIDSSNAKTFKNEKTGERVTVAASVNCWNKKDFVSYPCCKFCTATNLRAYADEIEKQ